MQWQQGAAVYEYIEKVTFFLTMEETNAVTFLEERSKEHISTLILGETIKPYAQTLAENEENGCDHMLGQDQ